MMKTLLSYTMNHYFKLPLLGMTTCLIVSCGSGPEYQEPNYEIKKLPTPAAQVDIAQADFEMPGTPVVSPETPLMKSNRGVTGSGVKDVNKGRPISVALPIARPVPGRPGAVFNPFNQNIVDVEGIPSGTKVMDPLDSDSSHIFRVP